MELITYIRLFRKWLWLIFLGGFLAGGAAFLSASQQVDLYRSHVTLSVGSVINMPNPQYSELIVGSQLARTYAVLARNYEVAEAAVEAGNFPISPAGLRGLISTSVIEDTSLLVIGVTYSDPVLAADMANEVANQLILKSPRNLTPLEQAQIDLANTEIDRLREELTAARDEQTIIDDQLALTTDPTTISQLRDQRNQIATQINQASANIAQFSATITALQQNVNSLEIVESARIQGGPISSSPFNKTVIGALVGAVLAAGIALLIEYLDDTVQSPADATQTLGIPTLAAISRFGKTKDTYIQRLVTARDPGSPVSEEYRTLRTNLLFSANGTEDASLPAFIVTSAGPSEGKSVTASNLAVTMAMAGWRVLLVDADLRRPRVHQIFNLENNVGLSTLLSLNPGDLTHSGPDELRHRLMECIQKTDVPSLYAMTSGHTPLNPTEILGSAAMQRWYGELLKIDLIDIILFDSPPALIVADSSVLASAIDVPVVLVIEARQTRRGAVQRVKDQFDQLGITMRGAVLNAVNSRERSAYNYGYYNDYYYYYTDTSTRSSKQ